MIILTDIWDLTRFGVKYQFPTSDHGAIYRDVLMNEYAQNLAESPVNQAIFVQVEPEIALEETGAYLQ